MKFVDLSTYNNSWFNPGGSQPKRLAWYFVNALLLSSWWCPISSVKVAVLRLFGAKIGNCVVIKPRVNIKYPWNLSIGNHSWIGEGVWIDNLAHVAIGNNVCVSQDAYLLTGNHDYSDLAFGLITRGIKLEDGAWVGARVTVCPGANVGAGAVVTAGSVLHKTAEPGMIYMGHPATAIRSRVIKTIPQST